MPPALQIDQLTGYLVILFISVQGVPAGLLKDDDINVDYCLKTHKAGERSTIIHYRQAA
jgi:hypothetical protein